MATQDQKTDNQGRELNSQAVALAEQLGRMAGTLEGTAEAWLNNASVMEQLTRVRDSATQLLNSVAGGVTKGRQAARPPAGASKRPLKASAVDPAHAPGKRRRKPSPSVHGAKKSDMRIPKMRTAAAVRRRRKSYA